MTEAVLYQQQDKIGQIILNRGDNRNSMTAEMIEAFTQVMEKVKGNNSIRCLIIRGEGDCFCAGGDFGGQNFSDTIGTLPHEFLLQTYQCFLELADLEIPIIGALNGHAVGGGFGLALICDIRVANQDAQYGANFARLGLHSGMSISYMLPRIIGLPKACELLFTGRKVSGREAESMGLVNYAVPAEQVAERAYQLAEDIASNAPVAVRMMKKSLHLNSGWDPKSAAQLEAHCQSRTFEMEDAKEGIAALLEKRKPVFTGR